MRKGSENVDELLVVRARAEYRPQIASNARPHAGQRKGEGEGETRWPVANDRSRCVGGTEAGQPAPERAVGPQRSERPAPSTRPGGPFAGSFAHLEGANLALLRDISRRHEPDRPGGMLAHHGVVMRARGLFQEGAVTMLAPPGEDGDG